MTLDELLAVDAIDDLSAWRENLGSEIENLRAGSAARIEELEHELAEANAKNTDLAARNYELLVAATAADAAEDEERRAVEDEEKAEKEMDVTELFEEVK